jgi:hypothetical protein
MPTVEASWVENFAARLLQLLPTKTPLDAVRDAASTFAESSYLPPEVAAEQFAAGSAASVRDERSPG